MYFGGIEGGATHSKLVICNESGESVADTIGPGTNHWITGISECAKRIANMVEKAKKDAGIPLTLKLKSLGLSLSGCEQEATNKELEKELLTSYPDISESYVVCSDTIGSIFTASPIGGLVVISGTGSNALLRNPDKSTFGCGGWGNVLGDEGSAWWISYRALKTVFDDMDNLNKSPYPIDVVWQHVKEHFSVETRLDLLNHCYAKFDKPFFANLCKKLSVAASEGDQLCQYLFKEAGRLLARHIIALLPKVHESLVKSGDLHIVCVGSVWFSWNLLKEGFEKELSTFPVRFGLKLISITKSLAYGAVYLGVDGIGYDLPRNYEDNFKLFYHYQKHNLTCIGNGNSNNNGEIET